MGMAQEIENAEPREVEMTEAGGGTPPDVEDVKDLSAALAKVSKGIDSRAITPEADNDDEPEIVDAPEETTVQRVARAQREGKAEPTDEELEQKVQKPWARLRIAEREKREAKSELTALKEQVNQMTGLLQKLAAKGVTPQDEDPGSREVDPEVDPAGAILQKLNAANERMEKMEREKQQDRDNEIVTSALRSVDQKVARELGVNPETGEIPNTVLLGAINHVAKVLERQTAKKFPDKSEAYRQKVAIDLMNAKKLQWVQEGIDPIDGWYEEADGLGFDFDAYEEKIQKAPAPKEKAAAKSPSQKERAADPVKARIAAAKEKQSAVASIAGVEGTAPKRFDASMLANADADDFDAIVDQMIATGHARAGRNTMGKTPSLSELLPGKGRKIY